MNHSTGIVRSGIGHTWSVGDQTPLLCHDLCFTETEAERIKALEADANRAVTMRQISLSEINSMKEEKLKKKLVNVTREMLVKAVPSKAVFRFHSFANGCAVFAPRECARLKIDDPVTGKPISVEYDVACELPLSDKLFGRSQGVQELSFDEFPEEAAKFDLTRMWSGHASNMYEQGEWSFYFDSSSILYTMPNLV